MRCKHLTGICAKFFFKQASPFACKTLSLQSSIAKTWKYINQPIPKTGKKIKKIDCNGQHIWSNDPKNKNKK